jgi:hypothetical protein
LSATSTISGENTVFLSGVSTSLSSGLEWGWNRGGSRLG